MSKHRFASDTRHLSRPLRAGLSERSIKAVVLGGVIGAALLATACAPMKTGSSLSGSTAASTVSSARLDRFISTIEADTRAGRIPGAVMLVSRDGQMVKAAALGVENPQTGKPMARDAIFRIYSMTKPIVSIGIMILVEDGRIKLADPVSRYLPAMANLKVGIEKTGPDGKPTLELVSATREMTVQDLLRHTSGLTYGVFGKSAVKSEYLKAGLTPGSPGVTYDNAEMIKRLGTLPLSSVPGSTWDYSVSTDVLGALIERVSGQTLDAFLADRILRPLKMNDTSFSVPPAKQGRIAEPFPVDPDSKQPVKLLDVTRAPALQSGGGGMVSTADDYLRFAQMMLNGGELDGVRIVSRKTIEYMTSDHTGDIRGPVYLPGPGYGFGLGVAVRKSTGESAQYGSAGDYYWGGFAGTYFWVDPKERLIAVWMMQAPSQSGHYRTVLRTAVYSSLDQ
jgi:CubicO group peptidase (beta-lactamase class C family)